MRRKRAGFSKESYTDHGCALNRNLTQENRILNLKSSDFLAQPGSVKDELTEVREKKEHFTQFDLSVLDFKI